MSTWKAKIVGISSVSDVGTITVNLEVLKDDELYKTLTAHNVDPINPSDTISALVSKIKEADEALAQIVIGQIFEV